MQVAETVAARARQNRNKRFFPGALDFVSLFCSTSHVSRKCSSPLTMSEIASELGLSRKTISAVVNGLGPEGYVSVETAQRVREHMERRGYVPSRAACQLRASPGKVVGLLHLGSLQSHLAEAFHRLSESLTGTDSGLEIIVTPREKLELAIRELLARRVTDLVWLHNPSTGEGYRDERVANQLKNTRTIVYNHMFKTELGEKELLARGVALVGVDRKVQFRKMARFLVALGHKVIALPDVRPSFKPYVEAFTGEGLVVADCPPPFQADALVHAMEHQGVTAAWFNGDGAAWHGIEALRARGVRIPEDLTVMGFDGMSWSYSHDLTTLEMPVQAMVDKVCAIVSGAAKGLSHCFDMTLLEGKTHGPPRG